MRVLIRRLESKKGTTVFVDLRIQVTSLRIGRGTDQDLEIADPRVALVHAEILALPDSAYRVEAKTSSGVWINGAPHPGGALRFDDRLDCGHFRITMLRPEPDTDLALLVEERATAGDQLAGAGIQITELAHTRLSRRGLAWAGFVLVLASMLMSPLLLRYAAPADSVPTPLAKLLPSDQVWNTGPMASTHAYFETECASCHVEAFEQVRNGACLACHDRTRHHAADATLAAMPALAAADCTACHREHNGAEGLLVRRAALCTDCHAEPGTRFPGTQLGNVSDFSEQHPPFSPSVSRYDPVKRSFSFEQIAQRQSAVLLEGGKRVSSLREDTGLIFPHDLHLAAKGIDAPEGRRVLACIDCHAPDRGQISFEPIAMEKHCADCHRLEFDPAHPTRVVPHGKPAEVAAVLRDHFAAQALSGQVKALGTLPATPERRRPGPARSRAERSEATRWFEQQGEQAVREVFAGRVCRYCHVVEAVTGDPKLPFAIAPLALGEHALSGAWFTHEPHAVTDCGDCHAAARSKASAEVLLPDIETCRACHGDAGGHSQVASDCIDCHSYHADDAPLWDAWATARKRQKQVKHKAAVNLRGSS